MTITKSSPQSGLRVRKGEALPATAFSTTDVVERLTMRAASLQDYGMPHHAADVRLGVAELVRQRDEIAKLRGSATVHHVDARRVATQAVAAHKRASKQRRRNGHKR